MTTFVHTLGDSTLDNLYWRLGKTPENVEQAKATSVEGRLQKFLGDTFTVKSHAYDGFTTKSVLYGARIGTVLPKNGAPYRQYMTEKAPNGPFVKPLDQLQSEIEKAPSVKHHVVLSVGGNDFRENLLNPIAFLRDIPKIQERHLKIVKNLQERDIKPILMLQYRTDAKNDPYRVYTLLKVIGIAALITGLASVALLTAPLWIVAGKVSLLAGVLCMGAGLLGLYLTHKILPPSALKEILYGKEISMAVMGALLKGFYRPLLEQAKKDKLAVLDLPNTFNPYDNLYDCGIEPGEKGANLIAEGIAHIVKNHDYNGESTLYAKKGGQYIASPNNPTTWKVS